MNERLIEQVLDFIKKLYPNEQPVPLHAPRFLGNEKTYLNECIDTTYVSYVGRFVTDFESRIKDFIGIKHAVAMVNGTAALHMALLAAGVRPGDLVITQALTFAATAAAIKHAGAEPVFVDVDLDTMGMNPESLRGFLKARGRFKSNQVVDSDTGNRIAAVVPMHTFGHPARIAEIAGICKEYGIELIEDAAESLGSYYQGKHTGTFGRAAILSFNGNKPVTTGGGGMLITDDDRMAEWARHISTTAKKKHAWEFFHDEVGFNLRMPNVNAAIGCAQMELVDFILKNKRETAKRYQDFFKEKGVEYFVEPKESTSNYWLNAIILENRAERDDFLQKANAQGVQTRPIWTLMNKLPPYRGCACASLENSEWLEDRVVNIPSSVRVSDNNSI